MTWRRSFLTALVALTAVVVAGMEIARLMGASRSLQLVAAAVALTTPIVMERPIRHENTKTRKRSAFFFRAFVPSWPN